MGRYIIRRILYMFVVLFVVSGITFLLMHAVPGGPFDKEKPVPKEQLANLNARYHLDDPLPVQYLRYLNDVLIPHISNVTPGLSLDDDALFNIPLGNGTWLKWMNFGPSYTSKSRTVNDIFRDQLPISFQLGMMAMLLAIIIGIPLGIVAGLRQNTFWDYGAMGIAILGVSVPIIVLGPILVWIFRRESEDSAADRLGRQAALCVGYFPVESWPRLFPVCDYARVCPGLCQLGADCAPDARQPAAGHPRRLHPHGAGQGPGRARRRHSPCLEEFDDPGDHDPGPAVRRAGDRHVRRRD